MKTGIILGSGLNKFADELISPELIHEDDKSFHRLKVYTGKIDRNEVVLFSGRRHFYEGYSREKILENVSIANNLGIKLLIITNAAGGINKNFNISDLMLITSHLYLNKIGITVKNNIHSYHEKKFSLVKDIARNAGIFIQSGSYCCLSGPMYETKSEIKLLSKLGIDAVGMSTVPEILYANSLGISTIGFSCITNLVSENSEKLTTHEEVVESGKNAYKNFSALLKVLTLNSDRLLL